MVRLSEVHAGEGVAEMFEALAKIPRNKESCYWPASNGRVRAEDPEDISKAIVASRLLKLAKAPDSSLKGLEEKGYIEIFYDSPQPTAKSNAIQPLYELNEHQEKAMAEIGASLPAEGCMPATRSHLFW
ncbi:MAG: hypothetical protein U5L96_10415 [Owenweeksia sp.]|nr:hypothetical protein [Owenweeksia sp.]